MFRFRSRLVRALPIILGAALLVPASGSAKELTGHLATAVRTVEKHGSASRADDLRTIVELQGKGTAPVHKSFVDAALGRDSIKFLDEQIKLLGARRTKNRSITKAIEELRGVKAELERHGYMNFGAPSSPEPPTAVILGGASVDSKAFAQNVKLLDGRSKTRIARAGAKTLSSPREQAAFLRLYYKKLGLKVATQVVRVGGAAQTNIIVTIPGKTSSTVVLNADYGATAADEAPANAALMEAGRALKGITFDKTIKLVHSISDGNGSPGLEHFAATSGKRVEAIIAVGDIGSGDRRLRIEAGRGEVHAYLGSEVARASSRVNKSLGLHGVAAAKIGPRVGSIPLVRVSGAGAGRRFSSAGAVKAASAVVETAARVALPRGTGRTAKLSATDLAPGSVYGSYRARARKVRRGARLDRDELMDRRGNVRPEYQGIAKTLAKTSMKENERAARQMVKLAKDKSTPTAYPRVMSEKEFAGVEKGLLQLERAMQAALKDIYSSKSVLLEKGIVTQADLAATEYDPYWNGVYTRRTNFDFVVRPDMIRGQDGRLKVIELNMGYVGGIGDVVRMRRLSKEANPEIFDNASIKSVAGFHFELANRLKSLSSKKNPKVVFFVPSSTDRGWDNEDYEMVDEFKRHGIDYVTDNTKKQLESRGGKMYLVSEGKREQVDVIYSRKEENTLGMEAAHALGNVKVFPTPGSNVLESKSLFHKMPQIIRTMLKEKPLLDFVETKSMASRSGAVNKRLLDQVMKNPAKWVIKVADEAQGEGILVGKDASARQLAAFKKKILKNPQSWTVQEYVQASTYNGMRVDFNPFLISIKGKKIVPPGAMVRTAKLDGAKFGDAPKFMDVWVQSKAKRTDHLKRAKRRAASKKRRGRTRRAGARGRSAR